MKSAIASVALLLAICAPALAIEPGVSGVRTKPGATVNSMKVIPPTMAAVGGKTTTPAPAGGPAAAPGAGR